MERKESAFLLFATIFLLMLGLLGIASFFYAGLNMINLLVFLTDGFVLGIGFCMSLFKRCIALHNGQVTQYVSIRYSSVFCTG